MNAQPSEAANHRAFDAWRDRFFAHYYAARPVNATFIGIHNHDDALPDFSPTALASHTAQMRELREELALIPQDGLDVAQRHDSQLADGFLELQLLEDTLPQFHRGNPAVYSGEGVFSVLSLFLRDAEPLGDRVQSAIARMHLLPAFLAQGRANVQSAPLAWTDQALREARAAASYFAEGLPRLAAERGITDSHFHEAATIAHDAFVEHARWLDESLRQKPEQEAACGREAFDRYLRRGHCLPAEQDSSWLADYANRALTRTREALEERAAQLDPTRTWQDQLADLADHHPTADRYYRAFGEVWDAARAAAIEAELLTWPDYPIDYVPVPASDREAAQGLYYLPYRCPAPFGRPEIHRYLVPPLPPDDQPARQQERQRAVNDAAITLNHVVHHGGLGHHVQNWHAFRAASRVGQIAGVDCASRIAMFCGGTLVEGWACYATDLMDEIGFLTPLESLSEAQSRLRMATRAAADVALHTGAATLAEIATFYEREAGMSPQASHAEAVKNSMFPGAAMMYLIGTDAIHNLRTTLQARDGAAFSPHAFHDRFLSYGAIPVTLIAQDMLKISDDG
jgi:uncharacterized protein (DUF885 family)